MGMPLPILMRVTPALGRAPWLTCQALHGVPPGQVTPWRRRAAFPGGGPHGQAKRARRGKPRERVGPLRAIGSPEPFRGAAAPPMKVHPSFPRSLKRRRSSTPTAEARRHRARTLGSRWACNIAGADPAHQLKAASFWLRHIGQNRRHRLSLPASSSARPNLTRHPWPPPRLRARVPEPTCSTLYAGPPGPGASPMSPLRFWSVLRGWKKSTWLMSSPVDRSDDFSPTCRATDTSSLHPLWTQVVGFADLQSLLCCTICTRLAES